MNCPEAQIEESEILINEPVKPYWFEVKRYK